MRRFKQSQFINSTTSFWPDSVNRRINRRKCLFRHFFSRKLIVCKHIFSFLQNFNKQKNIPEIFLSPACRRYVLHKFEHLRGSPCGQNGWLTGKHDWKHCLPAISLAGGDYSGTQNFNLFRLLFTARNGCCGKVIFHRYLSICSWRGRYILYQVPSRE